MENEQLRTAITRAGLTLEEFADIVQVDVKTVRRWLAGRTAPYPRNRARVAGALDTTEHALWPDAVAPPTESPERGQPMTHGQRRGRGIRDTRPTATRRTPSTSCAQRPSGSSSSFPTLTPDIVDLLLAKADEGCRARAIIEEPAGQLEPLLGDRRDRDPRVSRRREVRPAPGRRADAPRAPLHRRPPRAASDDPHPAPRHVRTIRPARRRIRGTLGTDDTARHPRAVFTHTSPRSSSNARSSRTSSPTSACHSQRRRRPSRARSRRAAGQDDGPDPCAVGRSHQRGGALSRSRRDCRACRRAVKVGAPEAAGAADRPRPLS